MPIDHFAVAVSKDKFEELVKFYITALAPLGYKEIMRVPNAVGLGVTAPDFWIGAVDNQQAPIHFAFTATGLSSYFIH
jgi:hypothetical protein